MNKQLSSINWEVELKSSTANESYNKFHDKLISIINCVAPEKTIKISTRRNVPWFTLGIKKE